MKNSQANFKKQKALVLGDDTRSFLAVIRSLSKAGIIVDVVTFDNNSAALKSRYIHQVFNFNHQSMTIDNWKHQVINVIEQQHYDFIFPCDERSLFPLIEISKTPGIPGVFALPEEKDIGPLFDKNQIRELAMECNIPVANGRIIHINHYDFDRLRSEFGDKVVLKPLQSFDADKLSSRNAVKIIKTAEDFLYFKNHSAQEVLVESYFKGKGCGVSVLSDNGFIKRAFAHTRVIEPESGGGSSYRKSVPLNDGMLNACKSYCEKLKYSGVAMFEFKQNMETNEWILIEINARFWGSLPLAIFAGVDFPADYAAQLSGENLQQDFLYRTPVYARNFVADVYSIKAEFDQIKNSQGSLSASLHLTRRLMSFTRIFIGKEKIDSLEWADWKPFKDEAVHLFGSFFHPLSRLKALFFSDNKVFNEIAGSEINEILFVCYGNIMRSPFAEFYFKNRINKTKLTGVNIKSFGFHRPENRVSPPVCISTAKKTGVDLELHRSKCLSQKDIKKEGQLIFIFDEKNEALLTRFYEGANYFNLASLLPDHVGLVQNIEDPYGASKDAVEDCYRLIALAIDELLKLLGNNDVTRQLSALSKNNTAMSVEFRKTYQLDEVRQAWTSLEEYADNSFFTSWYWIGTWLNQIETRPHLLIVKEGNEIIGIGFLSLYLHRKYIFTIKQLLLNRTGNQKEDQIWIEYNDFLSISGREIEVRKAALNHLFRNEKGFDELLLGVSEQHIFSNATPSGSSFSVEWNDISYRKWLKPEYADLSHYLSEISSNTRYQINRSIREYEKKGGITFSVASTTDEALDYFEQAGRYHQQKWGNASGFMNSFFIDFHTNLIRNNFENKVIDLIKISVNDCPIAFLYNFVYKKSIYFYLSGIEYENMNNKVKPGLVSHALAISHYAAQGASRYDFMGGKGRYKASLSDQTSILEIVSIRQPQLKFELLKEGHKLFRVFNRS